MIFKFQLGGHFDISIYMSVCHMSYWQDCSWKFNLLENDMEKKNQFRSNSISASLGVILENFPTKNFPKEGMGCLER